MWRNALKWALIKPSTVFRSKQSSSSNTLSKLTWKETKTEDIFNSSQKLNFRLSINETGLVAQKTLVSQLIFSDAIRSSNSSISTQPLSCGSLANLLGSNLRISSSILSSQLGIRGMATLEQMHKTGPHKKFRPPRKPLDGKPMLKGVVLKTLVKKPKKPNSANRKCVLVRLSNGKEAVAYVPGVGHNLQEHNIVLVRVGRLQDVPGVKLKCIRGKYDLPHPQKPAK